MPNSRYSYQPKMPQGQYQIAYPVPEPEPVHVLSSPPFRAWMSLGLALGAWASQVFMALVLGGAVAELHCLVAFVQLFLLVMSLALGIAALANIGQHGFTVIIPAIFGVLISAGTLLLCLFLFAILLVSTSR